MPSNEWRRNFLSKRAFESFWGTLGLEIWSFLLSSREPRRIARRCLQTNRGTIPCRNPSSTASGTPCGSREDSFGVRKSNLLESHTDAFKRIAAQSPAETCHREILGRHVARAMIVFVFFNRIRRIAHRCLQTYHGTISCRNMPSRASGAPLWLERRSFLYA